MAGAALISKNAEPTDSQLVFTLEEALREIAALRQERHNLIEGLKPVVALLAEHVSEMHYGKLNGAERQNICTGDLKATAAEFVRVVTPVRPLLVKLKLLPGADFKESHATLG